MSPAESLRVALRGVTANTLRSALTIVGLTIGVAAVIVLVAVGNGSRKQVEAGIDALGTNVLIVQSQAGAGGPAALLFGGGGVPLTQQDADALVDHFNAPAVKAAAPVVSASGTTLVAGASSYSPETLVGTTPSYLQARDYEIAMGTGITDADVRKHERVIVLGPTVVENLFAGADPIGQSVTVNGSSFTVVGVTAPKGSNGTTDQDDIAIAPLTAIQDTVAGYGSLSSIYVQGTSAKALDDAQAQVTAILDQRHDVSSTSLNPGFQVINQSSVRAVSDKSTSVLTTLLGTVAAISLLVGGIGVMNIMLVSVTERTREIGIRKAVGARRGDVLSQFLTEAVLVSFLGGALGVAVGIFGSQFKIAGVTPVIAGYSVPLAFGAAVLCGLVFGTYPALRAAAMSPIDALRFE